MTTPHGISNSFQVNNYLLGFLEKCFAFSCPLFLPGFAEFFNILSFSYCASLGVNYFFANFFRQFEFLILRCE